MFKIGGKILGSNIYLCKKNWHFATLWKGSLIELQELVKLENWDVVGDDAGVIALVLDRVFKKGAFWKDWFVHDLDDRKSDVFFTFHMSATFLFWIVSSGRMVWMLWAPATTLVLMIMIIIMMILTMARVMVRIIHLEPALLAARYAMGGTDNVHAGGTSSLSGSLLLLWWLSSLSWIW